MEEALKPRPSHEHAAPRRDIDIFSVRKLKLLVGFAREALEERRLSAQVPRLNAQLLEGCIRMEPRTRYDALALLLAFALVGLLPARVRGRTEVASV